MSPAPGRLAGRGRARWRLATIALLLTTCAPIVAAAAQTAPSTPPPRPTAPLLRIPFPQDDGSLTPYTFELGYSLMTLVYDTLLERDENGVPQPWLAQSVQPSPDGLQLTLRLAPATWQDGQPLTAGDVRFTFQFMASRPHPRFTGELQAVDRVDAPDPATVVIRLRHPSPGFVDQPLADVPILPAHLWQGLPASRSAPDSLPLGSGPYQLTEYRPGESYHFHANPTFFLGPPAVADIDVPIIHDADATFTALQKGQVDMVPASLPQPVASRFQGTGIEVRRGPSYLGTVLMFNERTAPFDRVEVRRAVAQALDLVRVTDVVQAAVPADHGYLHPASRWAPRQALQRSDPGAARRVLAAAGVPRLSVLAPDNDPVKMEAGRQVSLALQRVGLQADLTAVSRDQLSHDVGETGLAPSFQLAIWTAPPLASYDPDFLTRLFSSTAAAAPFNYAGYRSAAFDADAAQVATTTDPTRRAAAVQAELGQLADDAPVVPLFFSDGQFAYRPAIYSGWVFVRGTGILDKRSFAGPLPVASGPAGIGPVSRTSDNPFLLWIAAGAAALALVIGGAVVVLWLRR